MSATEPQSHRRRSRKSVADMPTAITMSGVNKENTTSIYNNEKVPRKLRSKSLGPDGLDMIKLSGEAIAPLKDGTGNWQRTSPVLAVKSILKPTLPLSPIQQIPAHRPRSQETAKFEHACKPVTARLIFDPSPPQPPIVSIQTTTIPVRSEEEQQRRAEILAARAARRQSLGNRRVSFAPEATLHTWDVVEYYRGDDSLSMLGSSANVSSGIPTPVRNQRSAWESANGEESSSRISNLANIMSTTAFLPPSTTLSTHLGNISSNSPPNAHFEHPKRQRSVFASKASVQEFSTAIEEVAGSSPFSSPATGEDQNVFPDDDMASILSLSSLDDQTASEDDRTVSLDEGDVTIGEGEMGLETDDNLANAFIPFKNPRTWILEGEEEGHRMPKESAKPSGRLLSNGIVNHVSTVTQLSSRESEACSGEATMDMTRTVGGIFISPSPSDEHEDTEDVLAAPTAISDMGYPVQDETQEADTMVQMDMTYTLGGIISAKTSATGGKYPGSSPLQKDPIDVDGEIDIDTPIDGIIKGVFTSLGSVPHDSAPHTENGTNEEMTMEFTSALGGVLVEIDGSQLARESLKANRQHRSPDLQGREKLQDHSEMKERNMELANCEDPISSGLLEQEKISADLEDESMDVTKFPGSVILAQKSRLHAFERESGSSANISMDDVAMDMTTAFGGILSPPREKNVFEHLHASIDKHASAIPETLKNCASGKRSEPEMSVGHCLLQAMKPMFETDPTVPTTEMLEKNITPQKNGAHKPLDSEPSSVQGDARSTFLTGDSLPVQHLLFDGEQMPAVISKPNSAALDDRAGFGFRSVKAIISPKEISKFRISTPLPLGSTSDFSPSRDTILATVAVKDCVPTIGLGTEKPGLGSPVIAGKLAKRKCLFEERLAFSPVGKPVAFTRSIHQDRTRPRNMEYDQKPDLRSQIKLLTPGNVGARANTANVPHSMKRRHDCDIMENIHKRRRSEGIIMLAGDHPDQPALPICPDRKRAALPEPKSGSKGSKNDLVTITPATPKPHTNNNENGQNRSPMQIANIQNDTEERRSLKDFLEVIGVGFIDDLTTTKRRHTGFIGNSASPTSLFSELGEAKLADCVTAGACTAPMLELFQHSCRELRKYTKEGRAVVKEIEEDTVTDNSPLFQEYDYAPPDVKMAMDAQFKDIKTHSRLLAKGIWYEWRMKLLDGVKEGLESNLVGLKSDNDVLRTRAAVLGPLLPPMRQRLQKKQHALYALFEMKRRIVADNPEELLTARTRLQKAYGLIEVIRNTLARKQQLLNAINSEIEAKEITKAKLRASIGEAERIKELNRGWSEREVWTWRVKTKNLEEANGWSLKHVRPTGILELALFSELNLLIGPRIKPIVAYIYPTGQLLSTRKPMSQAEQKFFIAVVNNSIAGEHNAEGVIRNASLMWKKVRVVCDSIGRLRRLHPTAVDIWEDDLHVQSTVLIPEIQSKMDLIFNIRKSLKMTLAQVRVVYGGISEELVSRKLAEWNGEWREGIKEAIQLCLQKRRNERVTSVKE